MELDEYDESVRQLVNSIFEHKTKEPEFVVNCAEQLIEKGRVEKDSRLLGYGFYFMGEAYYNMNDGKHCFRCISEALHNMTIVEEWNMVTCCYIYLGISSANRGNVALALDYNLTALRYSREYRFNDLAVVIYINLGTLSMNYGRYPEAQDYMEKARDIMLTNKDSGYYNNFMLNIFCILAKSMLMQNRNQEAKEYIDEANSLYLQYGENMEYFSLYCVETIYNHRMGKIKERDLCIQKIDELMSESLSIMDIFDDFYDYCLILIETGQDDYFWHGVNAMEPEVKKLNINNVSRRFISLKMKYFKSCGLKEEYLNQADLFYEVSLLMEEDSKDMMDTVLKLRTNLEKENEEKAKVEKENRILQIKSELDQLTGIANRFRLNDYSDKILLHACDTQKSLAVEILDIDYFKEYNDNYGHQAGDMCLKRIAEELKSFTEENAGFCARYGGDEFVLIYEGIDRNDMINLAEKLKEAVMGLSIEHKHSKVIPVVSISQGICWQVPHKRNQMWDFLHAADNMLYRVKKGGRNNFGLTDLHENEDSMVIGNS